ncbi:16S rRNA (guanine(527)-N(7))-methyltransferase RsmG [Altererythrobacter sp. Root672]|uniref:16S rRNA (guanine(527)-N(7))-methyltransferase RsmG n=1 Tax=Altererythrobacter sp. Root672 TaxID=1736584 RepID=UPI0006FB935D|nr:16S rRNA (guanine(527)-N(7))-methyltransferase RsmG [Altererythrobacter sp. Root672]KRA81550.1 16S rRNA (guanine(527)-N(7))-methyltransferase RsmG [Altererythrobacter sp. Root672]
MIQGEGAAQAFCAERTDAAGMERLHAFARLLAEENAVQNLVSTASLDAIWQRHFADSLQLIDYVPRETGAWLDMGSGAGFPGLVLAATRPDLELVLVESRKRRSEWLSRASEALGLRNCRVLGSRLENVETFEAGVITARAFAPLAKLLQLSARFSTRNTVWLLPKGRSAAQELETQPLPVRDMFHVEQSQTDEGGGILVGQGTPKVR